MLWHPVFLVESRRGAAITVVALDITKGIFIVVVRSFPILNELDSDKFDVQVHQIGGLLTGPLEIVLASQLVVTPSFKFPECEPRPGKVAK